MAIATGQFTIIDYNDALTLTGFIGSNQPRTQMFNPDNNSYTPNWTVSPYLVLTPTLFKMGSATDIITATEVQSVTWYYNNNGTETAVTADTNHVFSGTKNHILTIKSNDLAGLPGRDYICKVIYRDPTTLLDLTYKMDITFSRVVNGGGIADAIAYAPLGNVFKNGSTAGLTAQCQLWRGSVVDSTNVLYRWFIQDSNVFTPTTVTGTSSTTTLVYCTSVSGINVGQSVIVGAETARSVTAVDTTNKTITLGSALTAVPAAGVVVKHANYDADAGAGWRLIPADIASNITGVTTNTITLYGAYFVGIAVMRCIIKDTDSASNTYNQLFTDTVTFMDQTDPLQVTIASTGGDVFKNGVGSTTLTARVFQAGAEIDAAGTKYTYKWFKYDSSGTLDPNFGGTGINFKTGKTLAVGGADVTVKATFSVEVN